MSNHFLKMVVDDGLDGGALATAQVTKTASNAPVAAYDQWAEQGMN